MRKCLPRARGRISTATRTGGSKHLGLGAVLECGGRSLSLQVQEVPPVFVELQCLHTVPFGAVTLDQGITGKQVAEGDAVAGVQLLTLHPDWGEAS